LRGCALEFLLKRFDLRFMFVHRFAARLRDIRVSVRFCPVFCLLESAATGYFPRHLKPSQFASRMHIRMP